MNNLAIVVDVGNTTTVFGFFRNGKLDYKFSIFSDLDSMAKLGDEFDIVLKKYFIDRKDVIGGLICSVVPRNNQIIQSVLQQKFGIKFPIMTTQNYPDLKTTAYDINEIGGDLVADVYGAKKIYKYPSIVVDMGTITKILVIDKNGIYSGVSFYPGVNTSFDLMSNSGALLHNTRLDGKPNVLLGNDTEEALKTGMYFSTIHAIDGFTKQIEEEYGYSFKKILTGGLSSTFAPDLKDFILDETLTLEGIYEIFRNS